MPQGKCQICLRRLRLSRSGEIVSHHYRGDHCPGSAFAPIEIDDSRLAEIAAYERNRAGLLAREIQQQINRRANRIEPDLIRRQSEVSSRADKLEARLARLQSWPARFERQMQKVGYGDPPPRYIVERQSQQNG